jgi:hypothetical protein
MRRLILAAVLSMLGASALLATDGPLTNLMNLRGRTDENGYLRVSSAAPGATDGPLTRLSSLAGRTEENGYLRIALAGAAALTSWTTTAANTATIAGIAADPASNPNAAINCVNSTPSTVGVVAQWSPGCPVWTAHGWDVDDAVDRVADAYITFRPISANTVTTQLQVMMETSPFSGSFSQAFALNNAGQGTFTGSAVAGASSAFILANRSVMASPADQEMDFKNNAGAINAGMRFGYVVEANTGAKTPTALENNEVYTNTGDADGSTITLLDDPTAGTIYHVMVTAAQTITIAKNTGETLKFGSSTCGTSLTSNTVGSAVTIVAATGGSGAIWITLSSVGTWVCNA